MTAKLEVMGSIGIGLFKWVPFRNFVTSLAFAINESDSAKSEHADFINKKDQQYLRVPKKNSSLNTTHLII